MSTIASKYRLQSSAFSRPEEENQESPKSAVILSVEGAETERNYFEHLNSLRNDLIFHIEVLRHLKGDGRSAPEDVIDLLNEYIGMRGGDLIPNISDLPSEFTDKYSPSSVKAYLQTPGDFSKAEIDRFNYDLLKLGIDLDYRKYLRNFDSETDIFAVVLDRDCGSHSRKLMEECIQICQEKKYNCYITNPCFEFWLLLHLSDVAVEFKDSLDQILENNVISNSHTYVSKIVSDKAHHTKRISLGKFSATYLNNIPIAVERSKKFKTNLNDILDNLGSNLPELFRKLGY